MMFMKKFLLAILVVPVLIQLNRAGQRLVDGRLLNVVLVLMLTTAVLGSVLTARLAPRMLPESKS